MEFTRENVDEANAIVACGDDEVRLRGRAIAGPVIITRATVLDGWSPPAIERLSIDDFEALLALEPEVVLLGTGRTQRLAPVALHAAFAARGIGLEVMDSRAACRTYNVLLGEARAVAIALVY